MEVERDRLEFLKKDAVQGFTEYIGLVPVSLKPGEFITQLKLEKRHFQQDGFAHAGVIATMADHTGGGAGGTLVKEGETVLTVEFKINFLRPALGDRLRCSAKVLKAGRTIIVSESEVFAVKDGAEKLAAKATVTLAVVRRQTQ